jgi:CubicO group peptidase (beta-lactamase class C family)
MGGRKEQTMFKPLVLSLLLLAPAGSVAQEFGDLDQAIRDGAFGNLKAVIFSRNGEILFENYYRGAQANDLHQVQSVTKSVGSALVGVAHRKGLIRLDQPLEDFFGDLYPMNQPPFADKRSITVEQVLMQRHGIEWDESSTDYRNALNPVARMIASDDWYRFVLSQPTDAPPDKKFSYSSGASTLMSRFIRVATGGATDVFAEQEFFGPLGIGPVHWEVYSEDGRGSGLTDWPAPDHDVPLGFSLWLKARDMLRIGELYLNGGVHDGQRILDEAWVDASWRKYSHSGNSAFFDRPGWGHGYQWWIARIADARGREWNVYFASGWGSQVIFVVPELGLVMVTAADNYDHAGQDVDVLLYALLEKLNPRLDPRFNGAWYDPDHEGQGFSLEVREDRVTVVSFWYTYGEGGSQRWFLLQGEARDDTGEVDIYTTSGGTFLQGSTYSLDRWGTGRFIALDCNHLRFEFESEEATGSIPLTRLSGSCYEPP